MARRIPLILSLLLLPAACTTTGRMPPTPEGSPRVPVSSLSLPPGAYPAAFDAMRETLRSNRFVADRVDAHAGVLTTLPKPSPGLAMPWDTEQTTFIEEVRELLNSDQRVVRVEFLPMSERGVIEPPDDPVAPLPDLRAHEGRVRMDVMVILERNRRSGWRLNPNDITLSSNTIDPALERRGMINYTVARRRDDDFAQALIREVVDRMLEAAPPSAAPPPTSGG